MRALSLCARLNITMAQRRRKAVHPAGWWARFKRRVTFLVILTIGCLFGISVSHIAKTLFLAGPIMSGNVSSCPHVGSNTNSELLDTTIIKRSTETNVSTNNDTGPVHEMVMEELPKDLKKMVVIGVMTSDQFLTTRAKSVHETWGASIASGMILFFAGRHTTNTAHNFTLIKLPQVDDGYPPQRKSFYMLKYLYDHHINDFHWFVRADDDVYIHTERLTKFLRRLDSSKQHLIGHSGIGKPHEKGKLGLGGDNFCMGGPGVVMSHALLRKVGPYLVTCLNATVTNHEDSELGRCIRRHVGAICPWAQQTRNLFHQIYNAGKVEAVLSGSLSKNIGSAITVHPIKKPAHMFLLQMKFLTQDVGRLFNRASQLRLNRDRIDKLLSRKKGDNIKGFSKAFFHGRLPRNSSLHWVTFNKEDLHSIHTPSVDWVSGRTLQKVKDVIRSAMEGANTAARLRQEPPEDFKKINLGWMRTYATQGIQFIVDMLTIQKPSSPGATERLHYKQHDVRLEQTFAPLLSRILPGQESGFFVHFIVPLAGRLQTFQRFLESFEAAFISTKKQVSLLIVYFRDVVDPVKHKTLYETLRTKYPDFIFNWLELAGEFSRARALELGTKCCGDDALLFFCDVDLVFRPEFYDRCRANTAIGERAYFPLIFSQYKSLVMSHKSRPWRIRPVFTNRAGTWRKYGYGPACVYAADVKAVGGLNTSIRGWGLEDVDFYEKCLKYPLEVIRSPDIGLYHVYHRQANCLDKRLTAMQMKMCNDSMLNGVASADALVDHLVLKGYV